MGRDATVILEHASIKASCATRNQVQLINAREVITGSKHPKVLEVH